MTAEQVEGEFHDMCLRMSEICREMGWDYARMAVLCEQGGVWLEATSTFPDDSYGIHRVWMDPPVPME